MPVVLESDTTTVEDLVDRTLREWLTPADDQPVILTLSSDVTDSATTFSYDEDTLAPDEEDLLAPGVVVEVGFEQCRITAVDYDANSLTVLRGVNGTTAAAHSEDDEVRVAPTFSRLAVYNAVTEQVVALYPSLWHIATEQVTSNATYVEVPAEAVTPLQFLWLEGGRYTDRGAADLMDPFPPSSTGKALQFYGVPAGKTGYFTYRAKFAQPNSASEDVSDLGVDPAWFRIVCAGAAAQVVSSRPVDQATAEYIVEQLERESVPPGAATDIRNGLLTLRNIWLDEASRSLRAQQQWPTVYNLARRG